MNPTTTTTTTVSAGKLGLNIFPPKVSRVNNQWQESSTPTLHHHHISTFGISKWLEVFSTHAPIKAQISDLSIVNHTWNAFPASQKTQAVCFWLLFSFFVCFFHGDVVFFWQKIGKRKHNKHIRDLIYSHLFSDFPWLVDQHFCVNKTPHRGSQDPRPRTNKWLITMISKVGPLPNGRTPQLLNGGDPITTS